jgi:hypothetical protein
LLLRGAKIGLDAFQHEIGTAGWAAPEVISLKNVPFLQEKNEITIRRKLI